MTTYTSITNTELDTDSPGTQSLFERLRDNPIAIMEKASGAPVLANNYVVEAMIDSSAVSQGKLKTAMSEVSTSSSSNLVLPGGEYGFYPQTKEQSTGAITAYIANSGVGNTYATNIDLTNGGTGTVYAQQRYIQASPPYDLGDGEIPLFIFVMVDASGQAQSVYSAPEAPWHNNGPTPILAQRRDAVSGRSFRHVLPIEAELRAANLTRAAAIRAGMFTKASLAERFAQDRALVRSDASKSVEIEITQAIKQADMPLIPHPFIANSLAGKSVVLLDPVSPITQELFELHEQGESISTLIHEGYIQFGNSELGRARPAGVLSASISWRNTA